MYINILVRGRGIGCGAFTVLENGGREDFFSFAFVLRESFYSLKKQRNFMSCSNRGHSQKWQATAQWR